MNQERDSDPELAQLGNFLSTFNTESDRGAALVAASMLDDRLQEIITAFLVECSASKDLISGFNAPLGTFSSRASAAMALGLIQENEFKEITLIRKIRNEFGHGWEPLTFESEMVAVHARKLPWLGPAEYEATSNNRGRFNFAVAILLTDLMWRVKLVSSERRKAKVWPNKSRGS
jgi:hypothetical protein